MTRNRTKNVLISISLDDKEEGFGERGSRSACSYAPGVQTCVAMHRCYDVMSGRFVRITMVNSNDYLNINELELFC